MKYTKTIYYVSLFLIITFAGDRLIAMAIETLIVKKSLFRYSRLYNEEINADILFLGNSRGLSFYQPSIEKATSQSTFNLSYNGLSTNLAIALFKDYLRNNKHPKLVIIELTMPGKRKALVSNFGVYSIYSENLSELIKEEFQSIHLSNKAFHLTRYNGEIFQRCLYYLKKSDSDWLVKGSMSRRAINNQRTDPFELELDSYAINDYKQMIKICEDNKIPYRLLINPYLPQYVKRIKNFDVYKVQLSKEIDAEIDDFSTSINEANYFSDPLHLNLSGGEKYTKLLYSNGVLSIK